MLIESDDFNPSFVGCPTALKKTLDKAIKLHENHNIEEQIKAGLLFFNLGMNFYKLSMWMCSDYIPLYGFAGDCFKSAGDLFSKTGKSIRLSMFSYGRAGHCYRAGNECSHSWYCFFRSYEIAKKLKDIDLIKYYCSEAWKMVTDNWLIGTLFDERKQSFFKNFLLRIDGYDFQWLVWYLLIKSDFKAEVIKQTHDGGIDIIGSYCEKDLLKRMDIIVQCKNPENKNKKVPVTSIREIIGVYQLQKKRPNKIMFFTTTDFTKDAKSAAENSNLPILLVNADGFLEMLKDVYEFEVFSDDANIEHEEKNLLEMAGFERSFIDKMYEFQKNRSAVGTFIKVEDTPLKARMAFTDSKKFSKIFYK